MKYTIFLFNYCNFAVFCQLVLGIITTNYLNLATQEVDMKATVNEDCIGCGMCIEVCPEVFEINSDGLSHVVGDPDNCSDKTLQAAEICPVNAIEVHS